MTQATQRAAINTIVSGVSNIGNVYNRERWGMTWTEVLALLKATISGTDQIRAWMITCLGHRDAWMNGEARTPGDSKIAVLRTFRWRIQGFITFNDGDATEPTALNLATAVVDAMNGAKSLHDGTRYWDEQPPAQLDVFELRIFGGVLCHYAEITQELTEAVAISTA